MSQSSATDSDSPNWATIVVTQDYRDKIRVAKAQEGVTYEEYLREHLPVGE